MSDIVRHCWCRYLAYTPPSLRIAANWFSYTLQHKTESGEVHAETIFQLDNIFRLLRPTNLPACARPSGLALSRCQSAWGTMDVEVEGQLTRQWSPLLPLSQPSDLLGHWHLCQHLQQRNQLPRSFLWAPLH